MEKYQNGKIYKVINSDNQNVYIGSTVRRLSNRMGDHRRKANILEKTSKFYCHMREIGIEKFKIILIKNVACTSKEELERYEFEEMKKFNQEILLNENIYYKIHSEEHNRKVGESQQFEKHNNWKHGSIFKRIGTSNGYPLEAWCFDYITPERQRKRYQFSVKKYGHEDAKHMAEMKQLEIFPELRIN